MVTLARPGSGGPRSQERFTGRASDYSKYRPGYPDEIITHLADAIGFDKGWVVADIGSGTGILSRLFLKNGNRVFCVEPNRDMRRAAEKSLGRYGPLFVSVEGSAEATSLKPESADLVVVGQALHWFDLGRARAEFRRILRGEGQVAIIYNHRKKRMQIQKEYEKLVDRHRRARGPDSHDVDDAYVAKFLGNKSYKKIVLTNSQTLTLQGLLGRLASASYMPPRGSREWKSIEGDARKIVDRHGARGAVELHYDTTIYLGRITDG